MCSSKGRTEKATIDVYGIFLILCNRWRTASRIGNWSHISYPNHELQEWFTSSVTGTIGTCVVHTQQVQSSKTSILITIRDFFFISTVGGCLSSEQRQSERSKIFRRKLAFEKNRFQRDGSCDSSCDFLDGEFMTAKCINYTDHGWPNGTCLSPVYWIGGISMSLSSRHRRIVDKIYWSLRKSGY